MNAAAEKRHQELKNAVAAYEAREAKRPGLWDEELAAAKGKLAKFEKENGVA